jgi:HlyD family secretion protein
VRKQPTTEQNVVAYTVIAEADNPQRKLLPGMTANADIVIDTHRNVMKVPAAALRWSPPPRTTPAAARWSAAARLRRPAGGGGPAAAAAAAAASGGGWAAAIVEQLDLDAKQKAAWDAIEAEHAPKMRPPSPRPAATASSAARPCARSRTRPSPS